MKTLFIFCLILVSQLKIIFGDVDRSIADYFNSDTFKDSQLRWQTEKLSFENAIVSLLEENYGRRNMNVYVKKLPDFYKISDGFFFSDNVVAVLLIDMHLLELPDLIAPEVTFALASNFFKIEASLSKMIINTNYFLFRNQSAIVFTGPDQDLSKKSPFSFQQVQAYGQLTIIADDCSLVGYTITSLNTKTVNLGLDTFKVINCKFVIEICAEGSGLPPVIAPYFSKEQSKSLEIMLTKPIRAEMTPKLQAAVFSYINTSAIFGDKLPKLRSQQSKLFKETSEHMTNIVKNMARKLIQNNNGMLPLQSMEVLWNASCSDGFCKTCIGLTDMVLYGLDTIYSAHVGGACKSKFIQMAESIRFSTMQVRGKLYTYKSTFKEEHDFSVELRDVAINVEMKRNNSSATEPPKLDFVGWRDMDLSILKVDIIANERNAAHSFIMGYLIDIIPKRLLDHLSGIFANDSQRDTYKEKYIWSTEIDSNFSFERKSSSSASDEEKSLSNDVKTESGDSSDNEIK